MSKCIHTNNKWFEAFIRVAVNRTGINGRLYFRLHKDKKGGESMDEIKVDVGHGPPVTVEMCVVIWREGGYLPEDLQGMLKDRGYARIGYGFKLVPTTYKGLLGEVAYLRKAGFKIK